MSASKGLEERPSNQKEEPGQNLWCGNGLGGAWPQRRPVYLEHSEWEREVHSQVREVSMDQITWALGIFSRLHDILFSRNSLVSLLEMEAELPRACMSLLYRRERVGQEMVKKRGGVVEDLVFREVTPPFDACKSLAKAPRYDKMSKGRKFLWGVGKVAESQGKAGWESPGNTGESG